MQRRLCLAVAACLATASAGCTSDPRLDTSSDDAAGASLQKMVAGMGDAERGEFASDLVAAAFPKADLMESAKKAGFGTIPPPRPDIAAAYSPLDGLSVAEIRKRAAEARGGMGGVRP